MPVFEVVVRRVETTGYLVHAPDEQAARALYGQAPETFASYDSEDVVEVLARDKPSAAVTPALEWQDSRNPGADDRTATSRLVEHGFWEIGHAHGSDAWDVELVVKDDDGQDAAYLHRAQFGSEEAARAHAQAVEQAGKPVR